MVRQLRYDRHCSLADFPVITAAHVDAAHRRHQGAWGATYQERLFCLYDFDVASGAIAIVEEFISEGFDKAAEVLGADVADFGPLRRPEERTWCQETEGCTDTAKSAATASAKRWTLQTLNMFDGDGFEQSALRSLRSEPR